MKILGYAALTFAALAMLIAITIGIKFLLGYVGIGYMKTVGKDTEDAKREVFESTRSYVQGKTQELAKFKAEYDSANDTGKKALKSVIIHRFAEFDSSVLPNGLKHFLTTVRGY